MSVNWDAIRSTLMVVLPAIIFVVVVVTIISVTAIQVKRFSKSKGKAPDKSPEIQFLEDALEGPEEPERKPNPNYSYAEFQRDVGDGKVTFDEIYEKCGGVFPRKPEDPPSSEVQGFQGYQGYQASIDCYYGPPGIPGEAPRGASGMQGFQAPDGGSDGPEGRCPERMKELQEWFKERGKTSPVKGIVPPPPNPYPVIHKIYLRRR